MQPAELNHKKSAAVYLIIASHRLAAVIGCILLVLLISVFLGGIAHSALFLPKSVVLPRF